jgi:hypothetical protein
LKLGVFERREVLEYPDIFQVFESGLDRVWAHGMRNELGTVKPELGL